MWNSGHSGMKNTPVFSETFTRLRILKLRSDEYRSLRDYLRKEELNMKNMKKSIALVLALVLVVGGVVGGTIAWLTDETEEIKNTFTVGNIDIELAETTTNYKMIPGETIE